MNGAYARRLFSKDEAYLLRKASAMVRSVDEKAMLRRFPEFELIRCHELARAVGRLLRLQVVDGFVVDSFGIMDHSWLLTPGGNILDVYAPARSPMVQLVKRERHALATIYREGRLTLERKIDNKLVSALARVMSEEEHVAQALLIYNGGPPKRHAKARKNKVTAKLRIKLRGTRKA